MTVGRTPAGALELLLSLSLSLPLLSCGGSVARQRDGEGVPTTPGPAGSSQAGAGGTQAQPSGGAPGAAAAPASIAGAADIGASGFGGAAGGVGAGGASSSGGEGGEGGSVDCAGDSCARPRHVSSRWFTALKGYGRGPAWIRFLDDGQFVRVGLGEGLDHTITTLDLVTGEVAGAPVVDRWLVAADATGRRLVHDVDGDEVVSVDEVETARFGRNGRTIGFSADGSALTRYACGSGASPFQLSVFATEGGELLSSIETNLPCSYSDMTLLVDSERRRTLFAHPTTPDLYVFDWDDRSIDWVTIHQAAAISTKEPFNHEGTILNLQLSPDGRTLASIGAADGLAWLDADTLRVQSRVPDVPFFNLYDTCYCSYLSESPLAWSPSGTSYLTGHSGGGIALRDAQTHEVLSVLDPPQTKHASGSRDFGPVLMQFSADGGRVVALYPNLAVAYELAP